MGRFLLFLTIVLDGVAAVLSYLFGATIVPNVFVLLLFVLESMGRLIEFLFGGMLGWLPRIPVMKLPDLFAIDNTWRITWGLIWLAIYLLCRLVNIADNSLFVRHAPTNRIFQKEVRDLLVQQCYHQYREALTRFSPPPVVLRPPLTFAYEDREGLLITWQKRTPIIPASLLTPEAQPALLPLLALELAKYQSGDMFIRAAFATYPYQRPSGCLFLTGIFLQIPLLVPRGRWYKHWCYQRELEYDTFAYYLGQGEMLLQMLRVQEANKVNQHLTEYEPSTSERIGHLLSLLRNEYLQMQQLGLPVPEAPELQLPQDTAQITVIREVEDQK